MPFSVIKEGQYFRVKNTTTGKVGRDRFILKENAHKQKANRERFVRLILKSSQQKKKDKDKKKKSTKK